MNDDDPNRILHQSINNALDHKNYIGWGHFLHGCISKQWKKCIAIYYHDLQPDDEFTPNLWICKTVDAIWDIFLTIWTCQNGKKYGKDYDKQQAIALEMSQEGMAYL
jgi:hypothetical protein